MENPNRKNQFIFIIRLKGYIYVVPFVIDRFDNIVLKTVYPSRRYNKIYGDKK